MFTNTPRSLECILIIPLSTSFALFFQKKYSANISPCPNNTHPHATHYLPPFQNFQLCQFSPLQHYFTSPRFPSPNFTLPTFLFYTITPPTLLISSSPKSPLQHHYCTPPSPQPHSIFLCYLLNFLSLNSSSNIIHYIYSTFLSHEILHTTFHLSLPSSISTHPHFPSQNS